MEPRRINCPRCGQPTVFAPENAYRPFCSERCKLIDLGQWAEGKYAIPVVESAVEAEDMTTQSEAQSATQSEPES